MSKLVYASVTAKECRGNIEKMIRKFLKKDKKPSVKKRQKRIKAQRARAREEAKRKRRGD